VVARRAVHRATDRGRPRYVDGAVWHPQEHRFIYNAGQELFRSTHRQRSSSTAHRFPEICSAGTFTARACMRFVRSPDGLPWTVHDNSMRFDFDALTGW